MDSFWDFLWLVIISFLFFAYLMILFQIISDLFRDHSVSGGLKAVWMVCLIFFPVVTAVVYLIARGGGMAERHMQSAQEAQKNADAYIQSVAGQAPHRQTRSPRPRRCWTPARSARRSSTP